MEKDNKNSLMDQLMKEISKKVNLMEKEYTFLPMGINITVIGNMVRNMEKENSPI